MTSILRARLPTTSSNDRQKYKVATAPTMEAGVPKLAANSFSVVLFELPTANAASLFQVTSLATKAPALPIVVLGPANDETFAVEVIRAGAQEYFARQQLGTKRAGAGDSPRD